MQPENTQPVNSGPVSEQASPVAQPAPMTTTQQPPIKIGKFAVSRIIVRESFAVLRQDKEIMWFPVISSIVTLIAIVVMWFLGSFILNGGRIQGMELLPNFNQVVGYSALLIYYIVVFLIVNFFQAGLYIIVQGRFSGQNLSFNDGIHGATKNIGKIFCWSVISGTVGVILQITADKGKFIGKIVASLLGAGWNILTYFSLPALVIGNVSIKDSFKQSASMIRKTWGETFIVNFGVGLFFSLLTFVVLALSVGIMVIIPASPIVIAVSILFFIYIVVISIVSSTLNSIFKLVLFNYARSGQVPQGFSPDVVKGAVKQG